MAEGFALADLVAAWYIGGPVLASQARVSGSGGGGAHGAVDQVQHPTQRCLADLGSTRSNCTGPLVGLGGLGVAVAR